MSKKPTTVAQLLLDRVRGWQRSGIHPSRQQLSRVAGVVAKAATEAETLKRQSALLRSRTTLGKQLLLSFRIPVSHPMYHNLTQFLGILEQDNALYEETAGQLSLLFSDAKTELETLGTDTKDRISGDVLTFTKKKDT